MAGQVVMDPVQSRRCLCVLRILRWLLFAGCLFSVLPQPFIILGLANKEPGDTKFMTYLLIFVVLLTISMLLMGAYAAFHKHNTCLKVFAGVIATIAVLVIIRAANISTEDRVRALRNVLNAEMASYRWGQDDNRPGRVKADTEFWNFIQRFQDGCCGIEGPQDWNRHRPPNFDPSELPASCCAKATSNNNDNTNTSTNTSSALPACTLTSALIAKEGCMGTMANIVKYLMRFLVRHYSIMLFLAVIAAILGWCDMDRRAATQASMSNGQVVDLNGGKQHPTGDYNKA